MVAEIYTMQTLTKRDRVPTLLSSDRAGFKARKVTGNKEGHYIMIKKFIFQEDIIILTVYETNNRTSN